MAATARPCLPSAHSRKPLGKEVWELSLFGETPLFPAPLCQEALAKNWAKKGPSASSLRWGKLPPHSSHLHVDGHPVVTSTFTGGFGTRPEVLSFRREGPPLLFLGQLFLRSCACNCCCSPPTCKGLPLAGRGSSWTAESGSETIPHNRRSACKPELGVLVKRQAAEGHRTPRAQPAAGAASAKTACC